MPSRNLPVAAALIVALATAVVGDSEVVKVRVTSPAPSAIRGSSIPLVVEVQIAPGWHIHGHEPDEPFLIPTDVAFELPGGARTGPVRYPPAEGRSFAFAPNKVLKVYQGTARITTTLEVDRAFEGSEVPVVARLRYQACTDTTCAPPKTVSAQAVLPVSDRSEAGVAPPSPLPHVGTPDFATWIGQRGRLLTLLLTLMLGLGLNLTPCVYPLVSVTIAYFGRQAQTNTRHRAVLAAAYVTGIVITFAILGVVAALSGGMFGAWLQKPWVLVALAGLMVLLAASSFGFYQFRLPAGLTQRFGSAMPGFLGAFLMGASMGIVAAPCVGPVVVGLLAFVGQQRDPWLGIQLFTALGTGLGLPYLVLAFVAGTLRSLPRSGDWLVWVERVFGFVLLALAVYFIAPLLPRRVVSLAYAVLAAAAALVLGLVAPGSSTTRVFRLWQRAVGAGLIVLAAWLAMPAARGSSIAWVDYSEVALEAAKQEGRPVLIDFVADWCIPCHEMEATTFADRRVASLAQSFLMLRADLTMETDATKAVTERFDVRGVPTLILLDANGREVQRMVGYVSPEELVAAMEKLLASSPAGNASPG